MILLERWGVVNMPGNITLAACKRIIREVGAQRVSEEAAERLMEALEHTGKKISEQALSHARDKKRVTIDKEDVVYGIDKVIQADARL